MASRRQTLRNPCPGDSVAPERGFADSPGPGSLLIPSLRKRSFRGEGLGRGPARWRQHRFPDGTIRRLLTQACPHSRRELCQLYAGALSPPPTSTAASFPPLRAAERASLVAVASRSQESAAAYAQKWEIPRAYGSYEALLAARGHRRRLHQPAQSPACGVGDQGAGSRQARALRKTVCPELADVDRMIAAAKRSDRRSSPRPSCTATIRRPKWSRLGPQRPAGRGDPGQRHLQLSGQSARKTFASSPTGAAARCGTSAFIR